MKNNRTGRGVSAILLGAGFYYGTLVLLTGSLDSGDLRAPGAAAGHDFQGVVSKSLRHHR